MPLLESRVGDTGELARLIRELDWSATSLGPIDAWPESLANAVNMVLAAPIPMQLFWGPQLICIYNDAMAAALSSKHPESLGKAAPEVWSEAWHVIGPQMEAVLHDGASFNFEDLYLPLMVNGKLEEQYWSYSYSPLFDRSGAVVGVLDVAQDRTEAVISKRQAKEAAEKAARSEKRFSQLIDRASVGINIGDSSGTMTYLNRKLLHLLGYTSEEVAQGKVRWDELTPSRYAAADQKAVDELRAGGVATPYEKSYRAKDGHLVPVQIGATWIPALSPTAKEDDTAVFVTDLTNQKKAEAALLQAGKLTAVGKLASAISHEINNPLEAITNVLYIIRQLPNLPQDAKDYLEVADRELARVSQVAAQTLRFHRQSTSAMSIHPDSLMQEVLELYAGRLENYGIAVKREYGAGVSFTCFEGDVRQVLNNIVGNAVDAMRTAGTLTVRTRASTRGSSGQQGVLITVADSGEGISPEAQPHIFDAFFTTKGINGAGLGLWIACRIVHKHRGYIRARNAARGAVFQLWIPLELAASAHEPWHLSAGDPGLASPASA